MAFNSVLFRFDKVLCRFTYTSPVKTSRNTSRQETTTIKNTVLGMFGTISTCYNENYAREIARTCYQIDELAIF